MKSILLACILIFACFNLDAQNVYSDAIKISNELVNRSGTDWSFDTSLEKRQILAAILRNYLPNEIPESEKLSLRTTAIISVFTRNQFNNPFFGPKLRPLLAVGNSDPATFNIPSLVSSVGNLDITNLADAFAKFLVKRTKEELNAAFFERFYELIKKEEYKDARTLFPQTFATLSAIGTEIYNFQLYINTLRESFEKDLNSLLDNLPAVITDGRYKDFFNNHPELKATCLSAIYVGSGLLNKEHPGKILADYDVSLLDDPKLVDVKASVQTLQLFSESLHSPGIDDSGTDSYWVTKDDLKLLINDKTALQIYFGLVYQRANTLNIQFKTERLDTILSKQLRPIANNIDKYDFFLKDFVKLASAVTESIKNLSDKEKEKATFADFYSLYNNSLNLLEYATQVTELPGLKGKIFISPKLPRYITAARSGGNLALDINRRNYGSAIINIYTIYDFAFAGSKTLIDEAAKNPAAETSEKALQADRSILDKVTSKSNIEGIKSFLLRYGSFIAAVAQAENSDDVAKAIEAAALPSGSSRIKRETPFNVSLNAYTGLFYGREIINDFDQNKPFKNWNSYGVTAPIGITINRGQRQLFWPFYGKGHASYSLFISLIDLGAVAAYRFKDTTTEQVPTIKLEDIFSPGAFLSIGIPKTPLSLNFGTQMGPNLRKVTTGTNDYLNHIYWRYSASICVDIPLLNLYTKSN